MNFLNPNQGIGNVNMGNKNLMLYILFILWSSFTDDECRIIDCKEPKENKMTGHMIKRGVVDNLGSC